MVETVTIDKAGRLVLPKGIREALHISPGDQLELDLTGDRVTLKPRQSEPPLRRERGVWVYSTGQPLSAEEVRDAIAHTREQRSRAYHPESE